MEAAAGDAVAAADGGRADQAAGLGQGAASSRLLLISSGISETNNNNKL